MAAGQQVLVGKAAKAVVIDLTAATGWTVGRLASQHARFANAVADVNRYSRRHVSLPKRPDSQFNAGDVEALGHRA